MIKIALQIESYLYTPHKTPLFACTPRCYELPLHISTPIRQMKHNGILLTLVAALLFVACRTDNTSIQLLDQAEALMNAAPDTALALLDSIDSQRLSRADNARYALLRSQALDKNFIDITNDSLISIAVDYYKHSHNNLYKGMAYFEIR